MKKLYKRLKKKPVKNRNYSAANKRDNKRRSRSPVRSSPFINSGTRSLAERGVSYLRAPEESLPPGAWRHFWHAWFAPGGKAMSTSLVKRDGSRSKTE